MNVVCFIPARSGSKSIPGKNIKELGGKPLIVWTIETAFEAGLRVVVSTDGEDIAEIARQAGAEVIIRASSLAQDKTSMFEVLKSEIPRIDPVPDLVMLLSPTVPFRSKLHIKMALATFAKSLDKYDSLITAFRVPNKYHPSEAIVSSPFGLKMATGVPISQRLTRRQSYPEAWIPSGSIYLFKTSNLEKGNLYGANTTILETEETININSQEDFLEAEAWLKKRE